MDKYISKIANMTQTEVRVERLALEIAEKTKKVVFQMENLQMELLQHICMFHQYYLDKTSLQRDVSSIAGVTEVTIRNRCKEILTSHKLKITLRPSLAK